MATWVGVSVVVPLPPDEVFGAIRGDCCQTSAVERAEVDMEHYIRDGIVIELPKGLWEVNAPCRHGPSSFKWAVLLIIREVEGVGASILDTATHSDRLDGNIIRVEVGFTTFCIVFLRRVR